MADCDQIAAVLVRKACRTCQTAGLPDFRCHRWLYRLEQAGLVRSSHNAPQFIHEIISLWCGRIAGLQKRRQLLLFEHQKQRAQRLAAIDIDDYFSQCEYRRGRIRRQIIPLLHPEPV
ncbi:hypothetical protein D3C75_915700 [compost metagenome]